MKTAAACTSSTDQRPPPIDDLLDVRKNGPKLYAFSFFQCFLVIMPVIVPFFQGKGLTLKDIFLLQGIFGATLIVCDAPAGYLADLFGRRLSLVIGSSIVAVGYAIPVLGQTFWHFVLFELVLGVGLSLQSGCDVAILYNSLDRLSWTGRKTSVLGRRVTAMALGEATASILAGLLAAFSISWAAVANACTAWIPLVIALTLHEPDGQKLPRGSHLNNVRNIGRALFGHSRLLTLAISSFVFYGFATYCAVWSLQPYWKERGISVTAFGYLWAANCFLVAIVSRWAHAIEERVGSTAVVCAIAALPVIGYLGMAHSPGLWGLAFGFAFPVCRGLNSVIFQDAINTRVPAEMRSTTNSIGSLGMRALFLVFGPLIGHVLDTDGASAALGWLGWIYVGGFVAVALPLLSERKNFRLE